MIAIDLEQDSEYLSTSECHDSKFYQCCLFYERIFAGGYVLKKKT